MDRTVTIGGATLMLGDCVERLRELPDGCVDLVLADPPFCSGATREAGRTVGSKTMTTGSRSGAKGGGRWFGSDSLSTRGFMHLMRVAALEWQRVLKPGGHALVFCDWRMGEHLADAVDAGAIDWSLGSAMGDAIESTDLHRAGVLVWDKVYFGMGSVFRNQYELIHHFTKGRGAEPLRRDTPNVLQCRPVRNGRHPTEKPVELLGRLIGTVCPQGGLVADPFFGSCATGVAAVANGRRFVGVERDETFFQVGIEAVTRAHDLGRA